MDETESEVVETHHEVEQVLVVEDEHGNTVVEEVVEEETLHEDVVEVLDRDGDVVEEIVEGDGCRVSK